jgi:hypothetical protein
MEKSYYSSKYKIGQKIKLSHPFNNVDAEIEGVRFEGGTIRYDVLVEGEVNQTNYPDTLLAEDESEEVIPIMDDKVFNDCRILGMYVFENSKGELCYRYNIGYSPLKTVIKGVNSKYVFSKKDSISAIRNIKIENII